MLPRNLLQNLLLASPSLSLPTREVSPRVPPSKDPWYSAPDGFESSSPGTILRMRPAPGNLTEMYNLTSHAWNILFRTTDSLYQPSWAVTTLLVPSDTNGTELLSYQIPYNSADVDASPSYAIYSEEMFGIDILIQDVYQAQQKGWYVNIPDHEGPLASFGAGVTEGHAVLDSIRAVLNSDCGMAENPRYAMWGYSGGSIASEFAAELQVQYAPEMKFAGAALGGFVTNVTDTLHIVTGTPFAGLIPEVLLGLTSQYPEARDYLVSQLKPDGQYNKTAFLAAQDLALAEAFETFANQSIFDYFKDGVNVLDAPEMANMMNRDTYWGYHGTPDMPLFMYKAVHDEVTAIEVADIVVDRFCDIGVNIVYERNKIGGHIAEETNGDKRAFEWLTQVLEGTYEHVGCTIRDVALNVTDSPV